MNNNSPDKDQKKESESRNKGLVYGCSPTVVTAIYDSQSVKEQVIVDKLNTNFIPVREKKIKKKKLSRKKTKQKIKKKKGTQIQDAIKENCSTHKKAVR